MLTKMPTSYNGHGLSMKLPLHVVGDEDCVHVVDADHKNVVEGILNAADAHYIVDAVNEYQMIREAKIGVLQEIRKFVAGYLYAEHAKSFGAVCEELKAELTKRIEALRR